MAEIEFWFWSSWWSQDAIKGTNHSFEGEIEQDVHRIKAWWLNKVGFLWSSLLSQDIIEGESKF